MNEVYCYVLLSNAVRMKGDWVQKYQFDSTLTAKACVS